MKNVHIKNKLEQIGIDVEQLVLGDFDYIGEFTAKKMRNQNDPNWKKYGAFFKSSYERGILIYCLIRQYQLESMLEVGFGKGFASICAAKAFHDMGVVGKIVTIDPVLDEEFIRNLQTVLPSEWFKCLTFAKASSSDVLPALNENFDLVYLDGDNSYLQTKFDWEYAKDKANQFVLLSDYQCGVFNNNEIAERSKAINEIETDLFSEPELITLDRRLFPDDRNLPNEEVNYGYVLFEKKSKKMNNSFDW